MTAGLLIIAHSPLASALRECVLHVFADAADAVVAVDIRSDMPFDQLVEESRVPMQAHDSPLDFVATEKELIRTGNSAARPMGVDWERVRPDQFETIPFLARLRDQMLARRRSA